MAITEPGFRDPGLVDGGIVDPSGKSGNSTTPFYKRSSARIAALGALVLGAGSIGFMLRGGSDEGSAVETVTATTTLDTTPTTVARPPETATETVPTSIVESAISSPEVPETWKTKSPNALNAKDIVAATDPQTIVNGVFANIEYGVNNDSVDHVWLAFHKTQTEIPTRLIGNMHDIESPTLNPDNAIYDFDAEIIEYEASPFDPENEFVAVISTTEGLQGHPQHHRTIRQKFIRSDVVLDGVTYKTWQISAGKEI